MQIKKPNFNIVIKDGQHEINLSKKTYEVFLTSVNKKVNFGLQNDDLEKIIGLIEENDFLVEKDRSDWFSFTRALPVSETEIIMSNNGEDYIISYCSPCFYPFDFRKVKKTQTLVALIESICQKDKNVKDLPSSDFYLE